jgi:hypothetical protein
MDCSRKRMVDARSANCRGRWRLWLMPILFGLLGFIAPVRAKDAESASATGTYEILVCDGLCASSDSPNVIVQGHVVLMDAALDRQTVKRLDSSYFPSVHGEQPNGCYELTRVHQDDHAGLAGVTPFGITGWYHWDDAVNFSLYHSPDAGYLATVKPSFDGLFGHGGSWGVGPSTPQIIVARRLGDADVRWCEEWAARERK